jgi:hypothetical protein
VRILVKTLTTYLTTVAELYMETVGKELAALDIRLLMVIMEMERERPTERVGGGELRCREAMIIQEDETRCHETR